MTEKTKGVIAYLFGFIGGLIILLGYKDSTRETKVHAAQAITLSIAYFILNIAVSIFTSIIGLDFISGLLSLGYFVIVIIGVVKASKEEEFNIPIITENALKIFAKQIDGE